MPQSQLQRGEHLDAPNKLNSRPKDGPPVHDRLSTTNFLTAATLIYAIGAGITAAAGTRLALQWLLTKVFTGYPFQLQDISALHSHFLLLPRYISNGKFARLLPSLDVVADSQAPSPEPNPNPPLPVVATVDKYATVGS